MMVLASRRSRVYQRFPEPVAGYELDPECGYFSVIIPEATTNLVTNPSVEGAVTTGYTTYSGTMAAIATWQAYGTYGLQLTPAVSTESGCYYDGVALASGSTYTASVVIQGEEGKIYYIWFASQAGALVGTKRTWIGTGHKQRIWVTTVEPAGATRRIYVTRDAQYADQNLFYADGLQVEAKSYPTTYCDGDLTGFLVNEMPVPYLWNGTARASTSSRSAQTRTGGREMSLLSLGLRVLAIVGLGMAPLVDQALPMPGRGELAQGTGTMAREFTLATALYADGPGPRHLQALRSGLVDAFKPDLVTNEQPLILRYQACDDEGDPLGDSLDIVCKYRGGLEGNWDNHQQERLALQFKMYLPMIQNTYDNGGLLGYQTTVADADYILERNINGVWTALSTGATGDILAIAPAPDGTIYIGGSFVDLGGANGDYIVNWNGTAFSAIGTGGNQAVNDILIGPNGIVYATGGFTLMGGVAATVKIAKWDGAVWTPLGTGLTGGNGERLAMDIEGNLYVTGSFTQAGGVANTKFIAMWNGATWSALGTGADAGGTVALGMTFDQSNNLYVGGKFAGMGGVANTLNIAKWNGTVWSSLGDANDQVWAWDTTPDGLIYVVGQFTVIGGIAAKYIAVWNGSVFSSVGGGTDAALFIVRVGPDGQIYVGGTSTITYAGNTRLPEALAVWNGTTWLPLDVNLPAAPAVYEFQFDRNDNLYIGYDTAGNAISATVTVSTIGSSIAYPIFYLTGPGSLWQIKNYTTGKSIYLGMMIDGIPAAFTMLAGETAILNLNPINPSFISSFRGNIWNTILPGSNLNFPLMSGNNNISAFFYGSTTAATAIVMSWREQYWSLDGAAWK